MYIQYFVTLILTALLWVDWARPKLPANCYENQKLKIEQNYFFFVKCIMNIFYFCAISCYKKYRNHVT